MTRKLILSVIMLAAGLLGALAIDLNAVAVNARMHPGEIRELLTRFEQADSTLTPAEMSALYYGFAYMPEYDPRHDITIVESAYEAGEYGTALDLAEKALKVAPLSLELNVLALASADRLRSLGGYGKMILDYGIRCDLIATAILESGRGTAASSPFVVIYSGDMNRLLSNVLGISRVVDRTRVGSVNAVKVVFPSSDRQHILYFDNAPERSFLMSHPF